MIKAVRAYLLLILKLIALWQLICKTTLTDPQASTILKLKADRVKVSPLPGKLPPAAMPIPTVQAMQDTII
jgi:hypothetical protein